MKSASAYYCGISATDFANRTLLQECNFNQPESVGERRASADTPPRPYVAEDT